MMFVGVPVVAERNGIQQWSHLEDADAITDCCGQDTEKPLFESQTVGNHQICSVDACHLGSGGLEVVRVGTDWHQNFHRGVVTNDVGHHIPEDGGGHHDVETVRWVAGLPTGSHHQGHGEGQYGDPMFHLLSLSCISIMRIIPSNPRGLHQI